MFAWGAMNYAYIVGTGDPFVLVLTKMIMVFCCCNRLHRRGNGHRPEAGHELRSEVVSRQRQG